MEEMTTGEGGDGCGDVASAPSPMDTSKVSKEDEAKAEELKDRANQCFKGIVTAHLHQFTCHCRLLHQIRIME